MRIATLLTGAALFASAAYAQYDPYGYRYDGPPSHCESIKGGNRAAGAIAGALIGGLAGGAIGNNVDGGDYFYHHGRRGRHGRHHGYYRYEDDNSDEVVAGALMGAIIGGIAGAELGESSTNCNPRIYGDVAPPTRSAYGRGWNEPRRVAAPAYPAPSYPGDDLYGGGYAEEEYYEEPPRGRECQIVTRTTVLPSGERLREEVQACRDTPYDDWALQN